MTYILTWFYNLDTNKIKYKYYIFDQKASQAGIHKMNYKQLTNKHLGVTAFLLVTYIYIKGRVSLDTQWMILEIKVCMIDIQDFFQNNT